METDFFNVFKRGVNADLYQVINQPTSISLKEIDYTFNLIIPPLDRNTVSLRIEDVKEQAKYLNGGKRAPGKDYDLAIIASDCVYQIEMKRGENLGKHQPDVQLKHGERWLKHLLEMSNDDDCQQIEKKINIYLYVPTKQKSNRIRKKYTPYFYKNKSYIIVEVSSPTIKEIDLESLFKTIGSKSEVIQELW